MSDDMSKRECKLSDDHYWVESDEIASHCRESPE